jgi:uncharacterized membrane protein YbhN (UPF0104 family)
MNPHTRRHLKTAIKVVVTLILLAVTFRMIRPGVLLERAGGAHVGLFSVALLVLILGGFAGAASWFCILRVRLPAITYRQVGACHWIGMFFNSFLPSNVGGDVVKGYAMARDRGQTGFVVTSVLLDRALNLTMLLGIGVFALLLRTAHAAWAVAFLLAVLALIPAAVAAARRLRRQHPRSAEEGVRGRRAALVDAIQDWVAAPRLFIPALAAALTSQFFKTWSQVFVIRALGLALPTFCVWTVIPLFGMVSALPISIGGLGVRELVAQRLAGPLQFDTTHLVALSLGGHLVVVLVNLLGAVPFVLGRRRRGLKASG